MNCKSCGQASITEYCSDQCWKDDGCPSVRLKFRLPDPRLEIQFDGTVCNLTEEQLSAR